MKSSIIFIYNCNTWAKGDYYNRLSANSIMAEITSVESVSRSRGFGQESESLIWRRLQLGPYLFHLDFCVILSQSIWLLFNLFYN